MMLGRDVFCTGRVGEWAGEVGQHVQVLAYAGHRQSKLCAPQSLYFIPLPLSGFRQAVAQTYEVSARHKFNLSAFFNGCINVNHVIRQHCLLDTDDQRVCTAQFCVSRYFLEIILIAMNCFNINSTWYTWCR